MSGNTLKPDSASEASPSKTGEPRKILNMASVTPAARPMGLWVAELDKLDQGSQSLPVTPNHPPLNSARLVPMRSTPALSANRLAAGRRSAPGTPFMAGVQQEMMGGEAMDMMMQISGPLGGKPWADDVPETPPMVRGTPPFMPNPMMLNRGGYGNLNNVDQMNMDMMQFMMMNSNTADMSFSQGGQEWRPQQADRRPMGHHHHHHHHMHHGGPDDGPPSQGTQVIRLQVDPRTTLEVPKHHLRFTQRAEMHLRTNGHVGWCQRHHNTGGCNYGNGCAFAHVIDSMIDHYRQDAEAAVAANHGRFDGPGIGMGGKGGKGMHHQGPPHMMGKGGKGGPPMTSMMGGGWHGKGGKGGGMTAMMMQEEEEEQMGGRGMWAATAMPKEDGPQQQPTLSSMLSLQRGNQKPQTAQPQQTPTSTLSSNAAPFVRPARYWGTQKATAPSESIFVGLYEAVCDAISEVLKVPHESGETSSSAQERAASEILTADTWTDVSAWLRKQTWGRNASVAIDLCVAAGLHERPVEVLTGKMKRILKSCVNGRIRHVDLSLSIKEIGMRPARDMGLAIAAELRAQAEDLSEVGVLSLNHWELKHDSIAAIGSALPPRIETVEMLWGTGQDKWTGVVQMVCELRQRNQSSSLKIGVSDLENAQLLGEALTQMPLTHTAPLVDLEIKSKAELGHEGRELLTGVVLPGLKVRVPAVYIPPMRTGYGPLPEEVRVMCNEPQANEVLNTLSSYLTMPESERVNRVFFRGITAATAPMLGECIGLVLNNANILSMELQIARDTKGNLQAMLPVLQQQALKCALATKLQNLLIELKDPPEPELLDVCLLLPVKHILLTVYCDRNQLERVLPPFIDKLKKLDPPSLTSVMIDYGRGYGREHGMCRVTGPWSKCHMEWVSEDEADEAAECLRDPSASSAMQTGQHAVPGRFSHMRIAAEVVGRPLGEPPMPDAIVVQDAQHLVHVLQSQQIRIPGRTTIVVRPSSPGLMQVDLSSEVLTVAGVEFSYCDITLGKGVDLVDSVVRGGILRLGGGGLTQNTLIGTVVENTEGSVITGNKFVMEKMSLPDNAQDNLLIMSSTKSDYTPLKNNNVLLPIPKKDLSWHSPSAYFVKKEKVRNQDIFPVQGEAAAVRLAAFATLASNMNDRGLMVVRPVAYGCDVKSGSSWVMFDTRGPKLSDAPQQWSAEGVAEKASASISASLEELAKHGFAHGKISQDNIYITPQNKWVLGPPSPEAPADPMQDGEALQKVVNWALSQ